MVRHSSLEYLAEKEVDENLHYTKSVQIRSFFWSVSSCVQSEHRIIQTIKNSVFGHFSRSVVSSAKSIIALKIRKSSEMFFPKKTISFHKIYTDRIISSIVCGVPTTANCPLNSIDFIRHLKNL